MNTKEAAWIYAQEHPTDILIVGRMKRNDKVLQEYLHPVRLPNHDENEALVNMTETQKNELNEKYLSQHKL